MAVVVKKPPANAEDAGEVTLILELGRSLEKETATHSSIHLGNPMDRGAWRVHGVQSMGSQRVRRE